MLVTEIKDIAVGLGLKFRYGNPAEINLILEELQTAELPALVYFVPTQVSDTIEPNNLVRSTFPFMGAVLNRISADTIDYKSDEVQTIIDISRDLARKFVYNLNAASFIDNTTEGITAVNYPALYAEYDSHLFGCAIECTIPVVLGSTYCT